MHQPELDLPETAATEFGRQVRRPQALVFDLLLQRLGDFGESLTTLRAAELRSECFEREDLLLHELAHPRELCFEFWFGLEIPCHGRLLLVDWLSRT